MGIWAQASSLAEQTPAARNRYVDFLRAASILFVITGHWLIATAHYVDGALAPGDLLDIQPWTRWLTWLFQVMPIFFIVGGYANAVSLESARRKGQAYDAWLVTRLNRLVTPVSNSLPWYGVYLALANPLAGLGVVVGERVLRKPLQQFSSAKFSVTGTLDEPQINFVSLWDQSMKESELQDAAVNEPDVIDDTLTSQEELESRDVEVLDQSS